MKFAFFAYHGYYAEEKKIGNEFEVTIQLDYQPLQGTITGIAETINYVDVYDLLKKEMMQPRELLETLAMEIIEKLHLQHPIIKEAMITIIKVNPPIASFSGRVGVSFRKRFTS